MPAQKPMRVTVSPLAIIKIFAVILVLALLGAIRDVLLLIFVSMVLAAAFDPWVDALQKKGIARAFGILFIYAIIIGVFTTAVILMIPPLIEQLTGLYNAFPQLVEQFNSALGSLHGTTVQDSVQSGINDLTTRLQSGDTVTSVFSAIGSIFGGIFGVFAMMVMTFYMLVQENNIEKLVKLISPKKYHDFAVNTITDVSKKLGLWLRGQVMIGIIVGLLVYITLSILGVEYALVLGILSAITELIPFIGPWIGAVPGVLIAFIQAPIFGLAAIVIYLAVQQLENNIITPKLMSKVVGLSPLVVIVAILVGAKIAGVLGALLAVPTALIIQTFIKHLERLPE
ncbi:MAG: AI-2E family transporter [Patescibacteria group bacterium]